MPCPHCGGYEHALESCPKAIKDRKADIAIGRIILVVLFPAWCLGSFFGMLYSAIKAGFVASRKLWESASDLSRQRPGI